MRKRNKNIVLENIKLVSAGSKGVAVGKTAEGKTVLVSGAVPGDVVNARVKKSKSNYFECDVAEIVEKSPYRVEPRCIHFRVCGGCKWQNLSYEEQLAFRQDEVFNQIKRIAGSEDYETLPNIGSEDQYFYRNKMEFSFSINERRADKFR